jgi:hypothetical protein
VKYVNGDNLKIVRREVRRYFRNKKRKYLKEKVNELETKRENKDIRDLCKGINEFEK